MRRKVLRNEVGNRIRVTYGIVSEFSMSKSDTIIHGRKLFQPTMLITNLYIVLKNGNKTTLDHIWLNINNNLLTYNFAIGDCIAFTARPMKYEKRNDNNNIVVEIGIANIFNIKIIHRATIRDRTFDKYLCDMVYSKELIMSDDLLQYYYKIITPSNTEDLINDINYIREMKIR